ncbi:MAG: peptidase M50 [Firmicutes bacterium]|nr:peptidase M50 [Bacillota bacterium]
MKLGKALGVQVTFNNFFLLLIFIYIWLGKFPQVLSIFALVFLHELAHVVVARGYGLKVVEIELLPFGGVAKIVDLFDADLVVETYIALAGPMSNFFMAGLAWSLQRFGLTEHPLLPWCFYTNLVLGLFNLLPVLPLDGGRIYRAYLARRLGWKRATEKVAGLGQLLGVVFAGLGGLIFAWDISQFHLLLLAGFLFYAATREKNLAIYLLWRHLTRKKRELAQRGVLEVRQLAVCENVPLQEIVKTFVPNKFHLIAVIEPNGRLMTTLTEIEVIDQIFGLGSHRTIAELIRGNKVNS